MEITKAKRKLPTWMTGRAKKSKKAQIKGQGLSDEPLVPLPFVEYAGSVVYSYNKEDCALLCDDIRKNLDGDIVVGFDMEWPVTYVAGKQAKTALIQICLSTKKCLLLHVACMSDLPRPLKELVLDPRFKKAGVGIEGDVWKLGRDFDLNAHDINKESIVDLSILANEVLGTNEKWSLNNLCRHVLRKCLEKDASIRQSNWSDYPLSDEQMKYGTLDAYASLLIYQELNKRKDKQNTTTSN